MAGVFYQSDRPFNRYYLLLKVFGLLNVLLWNLYVSNYDSCTMKLQIFFIWLTSKCYIHFCIFKKLFINYINTFQILASLPRIMRDTEILQQEALLLREKMHSVKEDIVKVCEFINTKSINTI